MVTEYLRRLPRATLLRLAESLRAQADHHLKLADVDVATGYAILAGTVAMLAAEESQGPYR